MTRRRRRRMRWWHWDATWGHGEVSLCLCTSQPPCSSIISPCSLLSTVKCPQPVPALPYPVPYLCRPPPPWPLPHPPVALSALLFFSLDLLFIFAIILHLFFMGLCFW